MLTSVACDQSMQVKVACLSDVVAGISACFSTGFDPCVLLYITNHLMTGHKGNSEFCFPQISMRVLGNKIHCSP